jgi:hypothetical protein
MTDFAIGIWAILISIVILNGCAAGVVAILHAWGSKMRRGGRALAAVLVTGLLPAAMILPGFFRTGVFGEESTVVVLGLAMILVLSSVVSLPGALIVARKLEAPGDEFRTFE